MKVLNQRIRPAEWLLQQLGITEPEDIDIKAIAYYVGVTIKVSDLRGCDARLVGVGDHAIVTVQTSNSWQRQRFSIGHELGHWQHHRGRSFECRIADDGEPYGSKPEEERIADAYAADLLLPSYIFRPLAATYRQHNFDGIRCLADRFDTSLMATAIRLIDMNLVPAMLVCHGLKGRKWFRRAKNIPQRWFPQDQLGADSFAFDLLHQGKSQLKPQRIGAESWFDSRGAERYDIFEHSVKIGTDKVLTLLLLEDEEMLEECRSWSWR